MYDQKDYYNAPDNTEPTVPQKPSQLEPTQPCGTEPTVPQDGTPQPKDSCALRRISNVLSGVFSPLLIPTYTYAIVMWTTRLSALPEKMRLISSLIVFLITAIVPFGVILAMIRHGKIDNPAITNRHQRTVPFIVTIICYFVAAFYTWHLPFWIPRFFLGAAIATIIASVINVYWKISAHATAMGGFCAVLVFIGLAHINTVVILHWISVAFIISGAVCSARLYLERHTPAQVYAGWALGFCVAFVTILL